ncbi:MAG TPA: Rpn family recombination-promoting nuclease/putative transposase [Gemmataceae bacterium]|nr:Rpn family recombination-promoting nuclease/putative transposase [Gemmataceae bacterium]
MKTDTLFYRFLLELPEIFFVLVGRPATDAAHFRFMAVELKDTAVRIDGVYLPSPVNNDESAYFVEFQNHRSDRTYSNLLLKVGLYLEKVNPCQNWQAVVIYPTRSVEQDNLQPYRAWLDSDQLTRIYLDELPEPKPEEIGQRIVRLIIAKPGDAVDRAQQLIPQVRASSEPAERRAHLIQLIETVVAYKLPHLSRKELEKMLQVDSFRETKIYQEAFEEGVEEGIEKGIEKGKAEVALRLLAEKVPVATIAKATGLTAAAIKRLQKKSNK